MQVFSIVSREYRKIVTHGGVRSPEPGVLTMLRTGACVATEYIFFITKATTEKPMRREHMFPLFSRRDKKETLAAQPTAGAKCAKWHTRRARRSATKRQRERGTNRASAAAAQENPADAGPRHRGFRAGAAQRRESSEILNTRAPGRGGVAGRRRTGRTTSAGAKRMRRRAAAAWK